MTAAGSGASVDDGAPAPVPPFALLGGAAAPVCVDGVCVVPPAADDSLATSAGGAGGAAVEPAAAATSAS